MGIFTVRIFLFGISLYISIYTGTQVGPLSVNAEAVRRNISLWREIAETVMAMPPRGTAGCGPGVWIQTDANPLGRLLVPRMWQPVEEFMM